MTKLAQGPVLILGAGINGAALARELVINHVPVIVVDRGDISSGASAYSSRLIHGGLRYLEYGEFELVRESLEERNRLLSLAPQFVHPLRLFIPVTNRFGAWYTQTARFFGLPGGEAASRSRGLFVVRAGLWMYDRYARGDMLPPQSMHAVTVAGVPTIRSPDVRWLCAYSDAQIPFAERFVVSLLCDARRIAQENNTPFQVCTYSEAGRVSDQVEVRPVDADSSSQAVVKLSPSAIVNATGAWVDHTLARLQMAGKPLMGGTKGSHFVTFRPELRAALQGGGIYTEAADGRPIFVLPLGTGTLVGTTDLPFKGDPAEAVASAVELEYLLTSVKRLFPQIELSRDDIALHYSGVRPLPRVETGRAAGITRRHLWHWHPESSVPMVSLIGGKLTTCRAFAEQTVAELLPKLGLPILATSRSLLIEGEASLTEKFSAAEMASVAGTNIPVDAVRYAIASEWATTLGDLVERRLMVLFEPSIHLKTLQGLAQILAAEGLLNPSAIAKTVADYRKRLANHFGRSVIE